MEDRVQIWDAAAKVEESQREELGLRNSGSQKLGFQEAGEALIQKASKVAMECLKELGRPAVIALVMGFLMTQILPEGGAAWQPQVV